MHEESVKKGRTRTQRAALRWPTDPYDGNLVQFSLSHRGCLIPPCPTCTSQAHHMES